MSFGHPLEVGRSVAKINPDPLGIAILQPILTSPPFIVSCSMAMSFNTSRHDRGFEVCSSLTEPNRQRLLKRGAKEVIEQIVASEPPFDVKVAGNVRQRVL